MIVECKPDFALVKSITGIPKREIIHELKGKYEVCKQLEKRNGCKGLVDEDPFSVQPRYFKRPRDEFPQYDLEVLHDNPNNNRLIALYVQSWRNGFSRLRRRLDVVRAGLIMPKEQHNRMLDELFQNLVLETLSSPDSLGGEKRNKTLRPHSEELPRHQKKEKIRLFLSMFIFEYCLTGGVQHLGDD